MTEKKQLFFSCSLQENSHKCSAVGNHSALPDAYSEISHSKKYRFLKTNRDFLILFECRIYKDDNGLGFF